MSNLIYNRNRLRVSENFDNDIQIFGSSSSGNSIYFKKARVIIDLGFPYKRYFEYDPNLFLKVDYIMLTHEHSDHLNVATLLKICEVYPNVKILIPINMWNNMLDPEFIRKRKINIKRLVNIKNHIIKTTGSLQLVNSQNMIVNYLPHVTAHGPITNCAIELVYDKVHLLYASDLDSYSPDESRHTQGLPQDEQNKFDIICLEANYDENILYNYIQTHPASFRAKENLRHTSEQTAWKYVERFLKPTGIFIPLHASHAFGTLWQDLDGNYNTESGVNN